MSEVDSLASGEAPRRYSIRHNNDDGDEGPDDGGHTENGTIFSTTFLTITNVIGGGVLALPDAMFQASIGIGVFLCIFSSIASTYAVYILVKACDHYKRFSMMDIWAFAIYTPAPHEEMLAAIIKMEEHIINRVSDPELTAFFVREANKFRWRAWLSDFMIAIIFLYNFGGLVLYGVIIGDSLPPVVENFFGGHGIWAAKGTWLLAGGVVFFFFSCARKMSELKWTSILGFVTIFYVIVIVVVRYFTFKAHPEDMPVFDKDTNDVRYFDFATGAANAMTTFGLAYTYHYNVPYYYKELRDRTTKKMMMTAVFSQPVTFVSYLLAGIFGYMTFGAAVNNEHSGGNIVHNYAIDDTAVNIGRFGLFFHFVCVYPILAVTCRRGLHHLIEQHILRPRRREHQRLQGEPFLAIRMSVLETPVIREDPSLKVIAAEAFAIVSLSLLCAWLATGIKIVVNITGSLFGLFMMLVVPGIVGIKMFDATRKDTTGIYDAHVETRKYFASWFIIVVGIIFIGTSFYTIVT